MDWECGWAWVGRPTGGQPALSGAAAGDALQEAGGFVPEARGSPSGPPVCTLQCVLAVVFGFLTVEGRGPCEGGPDGCRGWVSEEGRTHRKGRGDAFQVRPPAAHERQPSKPKPPTGQLPPLPPSPSEPEAARQEGSHRHSPPSPSDGICGLPRAGVGRRTRRRCQSSEWRAGCIPCVMSSQRLA